MKKLGKLSINPEKVIKNEELISLRGGYGADDGELDSEACQNGHYQGKATYCMKDSVLTWYRPGATLCSDFCVSKGYTSPFGCHTYHCF